jgi:hypothetical protein
MRLHELFDSDVLTVDDYFLALNKILWSFMYGEMQVQRKCLSCLEILFFPATGWWDCGKLLLVQECTGKN